MIVKGYCQDDSEGARLLEVCGRRTDRVRKRRAEGRRENQKRGQGGALRTESNGSLRRHVLPQSPRLGTHHSEEHRALGSGMCRKEPGGHSHSPDMCWRTHTVSAHTGECAQTVTQPCKLPLHTLAQTDIHRYTCTPSHTNTHIHLLKHNHTDTQAVVHTCHTQTCTHTDTHADRRRETNTGTHVHTLIHTCTRVGTLAHGHK